MAHQSAHLKVSLALLLLFPSFVCALLRAPSIPLKRSTRALATPNFFEKACASSILGLALIFSPLQSDAATIFSGTQNAPSSSGSRVNKDADSLLRWGLPINNAPVRKLQNQIESAGSDIRVKRISAAIDDLKKAQQIVKSEGPAMVASVRASKSADGQKLIKDIEIDIGPAIAALSENNGQGSVQERDALDRARAAQMSAAAKISALEELMVKEGFKVDIPSEYSNLPQLQGRAIVEFEIKKDGDGKFDVDGVLYDKATLRMMIDGYNAPITGGNFLDLVSSGFYNGMKIQRSDGFVVQTGEASEAKKLRTIPLEIMLKGDATPMWGSTTEQDGRGYAATTLPFQSFGALGMARTEDDTDSASSQFFWLLFDSDLTPAGKNLLDGSYSCFGYTVEGADLLKDIKEGDIISRAIVISGKENLIMPK